MASRWAAAAFGSWLRDVGPATPPGGGAVGEVGPAAPSLVPPEQMGRILQRTAISTNIKERLDFSCALFGPDGGLVSNAPHIPVHLGAMQETVQFQVCQVPLPARLFCTPPPHPFLTPNLCPGFRSSTWGLTCTLATCC